MSYLKKNNKKASQTDYFYPILILVCSIALCIWYNITSANYITSNDAIVEGKLIQISSRITGPVVHLNVEENQEVKKGDVLLEIDTSDYEQRLKIVQYNLKEAQTKLYEYELQNKEKQQKNPQIFNTNRSLHRYGFSQKDFGQYEPGLIPEPEPDKSTLTKDSDLKIAMEKEKAEKARLAKEKKNLPEIKYMTQVKSENEQNEEEIDPQKLEEDIKKFEAQIEQMKLDLSYSKIYAPQDGIVSVISVLEGDFVNAGEHLISLIPKRVWITANVPANQVDNLSIGQPVIVKINKYRGRKFKATVDDFISNPQSNATGMIPVRIMFVEDYSNYDIQPGTPVVAMIKIK